MHFCSSCIICPNVSKLWYVESFLFTFDTAFCHLLPETCETLCTHKVCVMWFRFLCICCLLNVFCWIWLRDRWRVEPAVVDNVAAAACTSERSSDDPALFAAVSLHQPVAVQPVDCAQLDAVYAGNGTAPDTSTSSIGGMGWEAGIGAGCRMSPRPYSAGAVFSLSTTEMLLVLSK